MVADDADNAPAPKRRRGLVVLLAAIFVGLGAGGVVAAVKSNGSDTKAAESSTPAPPPSVVAPPAPPKLPAGAKRCPGVTGVAVPAGHLASCRFAISVRTAYLKGGPMGGKRVANGWAPQQKVRIPMNCAPRGKLVVCRGGSNSVVYLY
ncbi:MAG: hypothetical protein QM728_10095 [Gordonia sp. (in: high G+C Gram-positive bacteria)]|uniref:hypothetical protein n=1 Tax=Gordonia sp. (in: high G+C Gram-positive bacteria) TaxID=84139 RepID=UPI0039E5E405